MTKALEGTSDPSQWVELYGDELYRYAYSRLRNSCAAEETVQETFLAGIRFRDQFRGNGTEKAWLFAILRHKIVDYVRVQARLSWRGKGSGRNSGSVASFCDNSQNVNIDRPVHDANPSKVVEDRELWQDLQYCLDELPKKQAEAFVMRELEGMSSEAICVALEITKSNLWVLLHRARLRLAKRLLKRWNGIGSAALDHNVPHATDVGMSALS